MRGEEGEEELEEGGVRGEEEEEEEAAKEYGEVGVGEEGAVLVLSVS